jgi:hypothetical protein
MRHRFYLLICLAFITGCKPIQPEIAPSVAVETENKATDSQSDVDAFHFDNYKNTPKPEQPGTEWSESSLLNWSNFAMEFPDDDHIADQFSKAFAARKCRLTMTLEPTVRELASKWLQQPGKDAVVVKKHGLEIAIGGYREEGLIRMLLSFTLDQAK